MSTTYQEAQKLFDSNKISVAAPLFEKAIEENPNNIDAHYKLGICRFRQKKFEVAENIFRTITSRKHNDFKAWYYLGLCSERQAREDDAYSAYKIALAINPKFEAAKKKLGVEKIQKSLSDSKVSQPIDAQTEGTGELLYAVHRRMSSFTTHWILIILIAVIAIVRILNI